MSYRRDYLEHLKKCIYDENCAHGMYLNVGRVVGTDSTRAQHCTRGPTCKGKNEFDELAGQTCVKYGYFILIFQVNYVSERFQL